MPIQNIGSDVIQAFLAGQRIKQEREQLAQQKQLKEEELVQQARQFQQQLQATREHYQAVAKQADATFNLGLVRARTAAQNALGQGNIAPTSETPDTVTANLPLIGEISAPNPKKKAADKSEAAVKQAVDIATQTAPIKTKQAVDQAQALTPIINDRAKFIEDLKNQHAMDLLHERESGQVKLEDLRHRYRLGENEQRQNLKNKGAIGLDPQGLSNVIQDLSIGATTLDELPKTGFSSQERQLILGTARKQNILPIDNKTKADLQNMGAATQIFHQVQDLNNMLKQSGSLLNPRKLLAEKAMQSRIIGALGNLATALGGQKGMLSQRDVDAMKGYVVKFSWEAADPTLNDKVVSDFAKVLQGKLKTNLPGMSKTQRQALAQAYNLLPEDYVPSSSVNKNDWEDIPNASPAQ